MGHLRKWERKLRKHFKGKKSISHDAHHEVQDVSPNLSDRVPHVLPNPLHGAPLTQEEEKMGNEFAKNVVFPKIVQAVNVAASISSIQKTGDYDITGNAHRELQKDICNFLGSNSGPVCGDFE